MRKGHSVLQVPPRMSLRQECIGGFFCHPGGGQASEQGHNSQAETQVSQADRCNVVAKKKKKKSSQKHRSSREKSGTGSSLHTIMPTSALPLRAAAWVAWRLTGELRELRHCPVARLKAQQQPFPTGGLGQQHRRQLGIRETPTSAPTQTCQVRALGVLTSPWVVLRSLQSDSRWGSGSFQAFISNGMSVAQAARF